MGDGGQRFPAAGEVSGVWVRCDAEVAVYVAGREKHRGFGGSATTDGLEAYVAVVGLSGGYDAAGRTRRAARTESPGAAVRADQFVFEHLFDERRFDAFIACNAGPVDRGSCLGLSAEEGPR